MRQLVKHRAGLSLSEESGRYKELEPVFYVPGDRPLCQVGKPMDYNLVHGDVDADEIRSTILDAATLAYSAYRCMIRDGVAREVARMVLPLNLMTTGVITFNARSLMHFLSLRTDKPGSQRVSHPQYEIEMLADQLEVMFKRYMPITWAAFNEHGRLAP